jgi:hypothetical protein
MELRTTRIDVTRGSYVRVSLTDTSFPTYSALDAIGSVVVVIAHVPPLTT